MQMMNNPDGNQPLTKQERQRMHDQIREMHGQALTAHTMSDAESIEAMLVIAVENVFAGIEDDLGDDDDDLTDDQK